MRRRTFTTAFTRGIHLHLLLLLIPQSTTPFFLHNNNDDFDFPFPSTKRELFRRITASETRAFAGGEAKTNLVIFGILFPLLLAAVDADFILAAFRRHSRRGVAAATVFASRDAATVDPRHFDAGHPQAQRRRHDRHFPAASGRRRASSTQEAVGRLEVAFGSRGRRRIIFHHLYIFIFHHILSSLFPIFLFEIKLFLHTFILLVG